MANTAHVAHLDQIRDVTPSTRAGCADWGWCNVDELAVQPPAALAGGKR